MRARLALAAFAAAFGLASLLATVTTVAGESLYLVTRTTYLAA